MCIRGLFTLLLIEHLSDYAWLKISFEIINSINCMFEYLETDANESDHVVLQYLTSISKNQMLAYLMCLQSLLTINIITEDINFELLEENVKLIDLLWRVNKMKPQSEQIHPKEFHNDAINNSVDLKP
jgi:hypothetical protein